MKPQIGILLLILVVVTPSFATVCHEAHELRFKPIFYPGDVSYITGSESFTYVCINKQLPPVILHVLDEHNHIFETMKPGEVTCELSPADSTVYEPQTMQIIAGEAIFNNIVLKSAPTTSSKSYLKFTVRYVDGSENPNPATVSSPELKIQGNPCPNLTAPAGIRFARYQSFWVTDTDGVHDGGFAYEFFSGTDLVSQERFVPAKKDLPPVRVEVYDDSEAVLTSGSFTMRWQATGTNCALTGGPVPVVQGVATFTIQLIAGCARVCFFLTNYQFSTCTVPLTVEEGTLPNSYLSFHPSETVSCITSVGSPSIPVAVVGVTLPSIVIRLHSASSFTEVDTSNTGIVITAYSTKGKISGNKVLVRNGVATFRELTFLDNVRSSELVFAAGTQGNQRVKNRVIFSGSIKVEGTPVRNSFIRFSERSWLKSEGTFMWYTNAPYPQIVIEMLDSAYIFDQSGRVNITAKTNLTNPLYQSCNGQATMTSGIASFTKLQCSYVGTIFYTFTVESAFVKNSRPITSGLITFDATTNNADWRNVFLAFAAPDESLVWSEGQPLFATVETTLPEVVIEIRSKYGIRISPPSNAKMIAYTGLGQFSGNYLTDSSGVDPVDGRYRFSCLRFGLLPQELVRITFEVDGIPVTKKISTGYVSVTQEPVKSYAIRFRPTSSLVNFENQPLSAVQNIAIPPIEIEMIDSSYQVDDTNSAAVIVASSSSGVLHNDGIVVTMERGVARFLLLKFISKARDAKLTFTVLQDNVAAQGKSISTGFVTLTMMPIPLFHLSFIEGAGSFFTQAEQPATIDNAASPIPLVVLGLKDSAYQLDSSSVDPELRVEVLGPEDKTSQRDIRVNSKVATYNASRYTFTNLVLNLAVAPEHIYLTFTVRGSSSPVEGRSLVVGPISLRNRIGIESCASSSDQPIIILESTYTPEEVKLKQLYLRQQIASLMGVEVERVIFPSLDTTKKIRGLDVSTGETYSGSKFEMMFAAPNVTSTNKKSSATLAAEFVKIRPSSTSATLKLRTVYLKINDKSCDVAKFTEAKTTADACYDAQTDETEQCNCYSEKDVIVKWGKPCQSFAESGQDADAKAMLATLNAMCNKLSFCDDNNLKDVCGDILVPSSNSSWFVMVWLGVAVAVIILGFFGYKYVQKVLFRMKPSAHDQLRETNTRLKPMNWKSLTGK